MNKCSLKFCTTNKQHQHLKYYAYCIIAESAYKLSSEKVYISFMTIINSNLDYDFKNLKINQIVEIDGKEFSRRYERLTGIVAEDC